MQRISGGLAVPKLIIDVFAFPSFQEGKGSTSSVCSDVLLQPESIKNINKKKSR